MQQNKSGCVACLSNSTDAAKRTSSVYIGNCISIKFLLWKTWAIKRNSSPKNEKSLEMYSLLGQPICKWVCFLIGTYFEKFIITSLAHQWIFCSEWVPFEIWTFFLQKRMDSLKEAFIHPPRAVWGTFYYGCAHFIWCFLDCSTEIATHCNDNAWNSQEHF